MTDSLEALRGQVLERIQQANSVKELELLRVEALGLAEIGGEHQLIVAAPNQVPQELGSVDVVFPLLHGPFGEDGTIQAMFSNLKLLTAGMDWLVLILQVLGTFAVFAGLALALWHLSVVWKAPKRPLGKIWAVVLVLATAVIAWVAIAYHLVGLSTNY